MTSESDAYLYLEGVRWNGRPVCPHCDAERVYFLRPANGMSRRTRTGVRSERRVWKCGACHKQFSVLTGTSLHGTQVRLLTWFTAIAEVGRAEDGVCSRQIEQRCALNPNTAWTMLRRIAAAVSHEPVARNERWPTLAQRDEILVSAVDPETALRSLLALQPTIAVDPFRTCTKPAGSDSS